MARRTRKAGIVGRFGPRYGVRIRRRVQEIEEGLKGRHTCPRCAAISVRRKSTGVWACRRCGYVFAGGGHPPVGTTPVTRGGAEGGAGGGKEGGGGRHLHGGGAGGAGPRAHPHGRAAVRA